MDEQGVPISCRWETGSNDHTFGRRQPSLASDNYFSADDEQTDPCGDFSKGNESKPEACLDIRNFNKSIYPANLEEEPYCLTL